ncbi:MAG: fimbrillin family protein [Muribaculaceae bacterium]
MKSKFYFGFLAMVAIAATGCSSEVENAAELKGNAIEFGTYVGRDANSRATVLDLDGLKASGFGVFAYYTAQADYADGATANFMNNQKVEFTTDWTYSPLKYWPNNPGDKVTFFAYAPYNVSGAVLTPNAGTITFTVADAVADQQDLTVSDASSTKNLTKQAVADKVNFNFKHVLSRVGLNVEAMVDLVNGDGTGDADNNLPNGSLDANTTIKVTKVELIGKFDKEATINLGTSAWSGVDAPAGDVTFTWEAANFVTSVADNVTTTKHQLNNANNYAMLIPQSVTGMTVKITYDVITTDTNLTGGESKITNVITSAPFDFIFEKGKAYMFNLHLGMTSVKFSASVADWETGSEIVVNLPINNN